MSVTNERRHHLYQRLEQVLGEEEATTMMDHLRFEQADYGLGQRIVAGVDGGAD